jgi:hypothetical protein
MLIYIVLLTIRNEKVGCSIHLSGTTSQSLMTSGFFLFAAAVESRPSWIASCLAMTERRRNDSSVPLRSTAPPRHCEARPRPVIARRSPHPVIARRAAPWQSMPLCDRRWIASFLAMTGQGGDDRPRGQSRSLTKTAPMASLCRDGERP